MLLAGAPLIFGSNVDNLDHYPLRMGLLSIGGGSQILCCSILGGLPLAQQLVNHLRHGQVSRCDVVRHVLAQESHGLVDESDWGEPLPLPLPPPQWAK